MGFGFYLPFVVQGFDFIPVHDVMDGHFTENILIAEYWTGRPHPNGGEFLGGSVPEYALGRLYQPLTAIPYSLLGPLAAYILVDFAVRFVTLIYAFKCAGQLGASTVVSFLFAATLAASVNFSIYGFGIAGFFLALFLGLSTRASKKMNPISFLLLFAVAMNSSVPIHGFYVLLALTVIFFMGPFRSQVGNRIAILGTYVVGLVAGNSGLFYALLLDRTIWHRSEFNQDLTFLESLQASLNNIHLSLPMVFLATGALLGVLSDRNFFSSGSKETLSLLGVAFFTLLVGPLSDALLAPEFTNLATLNLNRLGIIGILIVIVLSMDWASIRGATSKLITGSLVAQMLFGLALTPHIRASINELPIISGSEFSDRVPGERFSLFSAPPGLSDIKEAVGDDFALVVGFDPARVNLAGINTLDGYASLYPLAYKKGYLEIIEEAIIGSSSYDYFVNYGSRAYTFVTAPSQACNLNFDAAVVLGAAYVLSAFDLPCLSQDLVERSGPVYLYHLD